MLGMQISSLIKTNYKKNAEFCAIISKLNFLDSFMSLIATRNDTIHAFLPIAKHTKLNKEQTMTLIDND